MFLHYKNLLINFNLPLDNKKMEHRKLLHQEKNN